MTKKYNDNSKCKLDWSPEKREAAISAIPKGVAWHHCNCDSDNENLEYFCDHYIPNTCMPYWLCLDHSKNWIKTTEGFGGKKLNNPVQKACDYCVVSSGLFY